MLSKSEKRFIESMRQKVGRGINEYGMLKDGDKVVAALSGGKDSLVMLETMAVRRRYIPIDYEITALHIKIDDVAYEADPIFMQNLCDELEIPLVIKTIHAGLEERKGEKKACFVCSWHRRKELFKTVEELGYNKLAFGHHMDDMLETLLMNMVFHAEISSIPPTISMFEGKIEVIRPLTLLQNSETKRYAKLREFKKMEKECPYEIENHREKFRDIVYQLGKLNPKARQNMFNAMKRIEPDYLP